MADSLPVVRAPLVGATAAVALLYVFSSVLWPLVLAVVVVIAIKAVQRRVARIWPHANQRLILLIAGVLSLGLLFTTEVTALPGLAAVGDNLPLILANIDAALTAASDRLGLETPVTLENVLGGFDARAVAATLVNGLSRAVVCLMLTALFVFFLLLSWRKIEKRVQLASGPQGRRAVVVVARSVRSVESYLRIQTITSLITAVTSGLIMFSVGFDHWAPWAAAIFVLTFIPFVGAAVGSVGPALMALLQFPSGGPSLVIFLGIQVVAFVVGNLIAPRLLAGAQNLDPSITLLSVAAWTIVWGLPGAFLAVPLTLPLVHALAHSRSGRWLAIMISHDGFPSRRMR